MCIVPDALERELIPLSVFDHDLCVLAHALMASWCMAALGFGPRRRLICVMLPVAARMGLLVWVVSFPTLESSDSRLVWGTESPDG